jgi:hypothetical protein
MKKPQVFRYSPRQVALMIAIADHFDDLSGRIFESPGRIRDMAKGETQPSDGVLSALELKRNVGGFHFKTS